MLHEEGTAAEPEESGREHVGRRLLDVESLQDVERCEHEQRHDRQVESAPAAAAQINTGDEQDPGDGNRKRV